MRKSFEQLIDNPTLLREFVVERFAVGQMQGLDNTRFIAPFAFASDTSLIASEGLQKIALDARIKKLDRLGSLGIKLGIVSITAQKDDLVKFARHCRDACDRIMDYFGHESLGIVVREMFTIRLIPIARVA